MWSDLSRPFMLQHLGIVDCVAWDSSSIKLTSGHTSLFVSCAINKVTNAGNMGQLLLHRTYGQNNVLSMKKWLVDIGGGGGWPRFLNWNPKYYFWC